MKKHIVCFGDSNTHGYCADPNDCADAPFTRFNEEERWTQLLQKHLGEEYLIIEEGLNGRTTAFPDPVEDGLCGIDYLWPCLKTHKPIDLLIIMLGTNDTKERFSANAHTISRGMERLIESIQHRDCWKENRSNILVICPPSIGEGLLSSPVAAEMGPDAIQKSRQLPDYYRNLCKSLGVHYLDAGTAGITFNEVDFMHLTKASHKKMADLLADLIPTLL